MILTPFDVYRLILPKDSGYTEVPFIPSLTTNANSLQIVTQVVKPFDFLVFCQGFTTKLDEKNILYEFYMPAKGFYGYFPSSFLPYLEKSAAPWLAKNTALAWSRHHKPL